MSLANRQLIPLLKQVSRSFYLTLRILPGTIRPQIGIAYLLARATDTIADTNLVAIDRRLAALRQLKKAIAVSAAGAQAETPDLGELSAAQEVPAGQGSSGERRLLERIDEALHALRGLSSEDRVLICEVLDTITRGQETDLLRFGNAAEDKLVALENEAELEDYTYSVAGCVGEFWTRMCQSHLFPEAAINQNQMLSNGIRFGKGLQLVNILRDIPKDLRLGRCYVPASLLAEKNLTPRELLDPGSMSRFRGPYDRLLQQARGHLAAGWRYTNTIPRNQVRVRLACAWPVLIGMRTLQYLEAGNVLDNRRRIMMPQSEVYWMIFRSIVAYPFSAAWSRQVES